PEDRFIVLISACSLQDERKGMRHLLKALELLKLPDLLLVTTGHVPESARPGLKEVHALGYINEPARMAQAYGAADVFVGPFLEDSFGQVFLEAAACGRPSIGYPAGGVPEAIAHGVSGWLATRTDPPDLADALELLHADPELCADLGRWGRLWVENEWSFASAYYRFHKVLKELGNADLVGSAPDLVFHPETAEV